MIAKDAEGMNPLQPWRKVLPLIQQDFIRVIGEILG